MHKDRLRRNHLANQKIYATKIDQSQFQKNIVQLDHYRPITNNQQLTHNTRHIFTSTCIVLASTSSSLQPMLQRTMPMTFKKRQGHYYWHEYQEHSNSNSSSISHSSGTQHHRDITDNDD